ncbi:MAG: hypothetical protein WDN45_11425 [Caulobacteraceae bacterium]
MPATWIQDMSGEEFERRLGLTSGQQGRVTVNSFLLKLGDTYAMVDAGSGPTMGPNLGLQPDSLRAAGRAAGGNPGDFPDPLPPGPLQRPDRRGGHPDLSQRGDLCP